MTATRVGAIQPAQSIEVMPTPASLRDLEVAGDGALRPTGRATRVVYRLPPVAAGITGIRLRLRLYKPVDEALWRQVAKSYLNLLDAEGLQLATERTVAIPDPALADRLVRDQMWTRGGLLERLDVGT